MKYLNLRGFSGKEAVRGLSNLCDLVIQWTAYVLAAAIPLFFLPWTVDTLEFNKQMLVVAAATIMGLAWVAKMYVERRVEYRSSILNVFVALYVLVYAASAWNSSSRYLSLVGDSGQEMAGLVTVLAFAVIYFTVTSNFREARELRSLLAASVVGGFVTAVYALLQGLGMHTLPFDFAQSSSFNTVGTASALGIYLSYIATLCGGLLLSHNGRKQGSNFGAVASDFLLWLTGVISLFLICVIAYWPVTVCLLAANTVLILFAFFHARSVRNVGGTLLPTIAIVVSLLTLVFKFPIALGYPAEVMPSVKASVDIASKTLRESPLFGSGPGTFVFDYAKHRAQEVNTSQFWNIRFDRGSSHFLTSLATTGLIGTLPWLLMSLVLLISSGLTLVRAKDDTWHIVVGVLAGWIALLVARFLYSSNMAIETAFWLSMAMLVVSHKHQFMAADFERSPRAAMSVSFLFILGIVVALAGLFVQGTRYAAEAAYARALKADTTQVSIDEVLSSLETAVQFNGQSDVYLRNLSAAYIAKANALLSEEIKVEDKKDETNEDHDKRLQVARKEQLDKVSKYTAAAVNSAKGATEIAPKNVANWANLASVYQGLMGISEGADEWAIKGFDSAAELEPANPTFSAEIAKVHLFRADLADQMLRSAKDDAAKADAKAKGEEALGKAIDAANKAIELKADYAPAHFTVAAAYARQGKVAEAISKMEAAARFNPQDIGVQFQLALLYYQAERKDDAMQLLQAIIAQQPNFSNARWYLGAMYEETGKLDEAIAQIEEVAKLNPDSDAVKRKQADLAAKKSGEPGLPEPVDQSIEDQQPKVKAPTVTR